jgi:hypothetical protein
LLLGKGLLIAAFEHSCPAVQQQMKSQIMLGIIHVQCVLALCVIHDRRWHTCARHPYHAETPFPDPPRNSRFFPVSGSHLVQPI